MVNRLRIDAIPISLWPKPGSWCFVRGVPIPIYSIISGWQIAIFFSWFIMIYLLRLVSEGYNFGLIRLYLMWFEICKYVYIYIQYMHCMPWVPCELLCWFSIWILSGLIWLMDLLMFDFWIASQEVTPGTTHTHNTHTRQEWIIIWSGGNWILKHAD